MKRRIVPAVQQAMLICVAFTGLATAQETDSWTSWRGPKDFGSVETGSFPASLANDKLRWSAPLPGKGCSTPIHFGGRIYLTAPQDAKDALLCMDGNGKQIWLTNFEQEDAGKHRNGSGCNASPVTDGQSIYVYFKSGTFAAVGLDGKVLWQTNLVKTYGKDTLFWDHGTSPVLTKKHVIMARMHQGESWLAAFDKKTGELAWKVDRNYKVPTECDHGYTTPLVMEYQGKESILIWGAEHVTIHDATDGKMVWSCGNFNPDGAQLWPAIATPVVVDGTAVIAYGRNDRGIPRLHGIRLTGSGDTTATSHVWRRDDVGTFVPTPAVYRGNVVLVRDHGEVEGVDPATGKTAWKGEFPKGRANFYSSPLVAGEKLYAPREDGVVFVAKIENDGLRLLSENNLQQPIIGSPVPFANGVLIRGETNLMYFGD
jgi:outer membrane protein assembly factor BamB